MDQENERLSLGNLLRLILHKPHIRKIIEDTDIATGLSLSLFCFRSSFIVLLLVNTPQLEFSLYHQPSFCVIHCISFPSSLTSSLDRIYIAFETQGAGPPSFPDSWLSLALSFYWWLVNQFILNS